MDAFEDPVFCAFVALTAVCFLGVLAACFY